MPNPNFKNPDYQRELRSRVSHASNVANGKRGYAACVAKYGPEFAAERFAAHRLKHPSEPERIVMQWLDSRAVAYAREHPLGSGLYADFFLCDRGLVIEVDGTGFHTPQGEALHGDVAGRAANDERKALFCAELNLQLVRLTEKDIRNGTARDQLTEALALVTPL